KSSVTKSDLTDPSFSAAVHGWVPSNVRSRVVISVLRLVDIDEAGLRERLAHAVHVQPEFAGREFFSLALLVGVALFAFCHDVSDIPAAHHDDAIVIGDHGIAGMHVDAGADHGNV